MPPLQESNPHKLFEHTQHTAIIVFRSVCHFPHSNQPTCSGIVVNKEKVGGQSVEESADLRVLRIGEESADRPPTKRSGRSKARSSGGTRIAEFVPIARCVVQRRPQPIPPPVLLLTLSTAYVTATPLFLFLICFG